MIPDTSESSACWGFISVEEKMLIAQFWNPVGNAQLGSIGSLASKPCLVEHAKRVRAQLPRGPYAVDRGANFAFATVLWQRHALG